MQTIQSIVEKHLVPLARYRYGFADLRGLLAKEFGEYNYGISIARRFEDAVINKIKDGPTLEYFHYYKEVNAGLKAISLAIHADLKAAGIAALVVDPSISSGTPGYEEYLKTLTYSVSHKMVATRAGLGWIGKTALFVSPEFGPRLRLTSILLRDDPGGCGVPVNESLCGKCTLCVDICPAGAANGKSWDIMTHRDDFFDAKACREMCGELARTKLGVDERICGMCVYICPKGKKQQK